MRTFAVCSLLTVMSCVIPAQAAEAKSGGPVIDHVVKTLSGESFDMKSLRGKAVLVVNTASKCGYTPQYAKLQALYDAYKDRGLVVVGFPSNDFGAQEPGTAEDIATFCKKNYGVTFPMMAKVATKGPEKAPIYRVLTEETGEGIKGDVKWNFTKFLLDGNGAVIARFEPGVDPLSDDMKAAVERVLPRS